MQTAPQISFKGMEASAALQQLIEEEIEKLERYYEDITTVRVVVDQPHRSQQLGRRFDVRIQIGVRGDELVVDRSPGRDEQHEDPRLTVRQAFRAARRQVQDWVANRRGKVKVHQEQPTGVVFRIFPQDGYGFIKTPDGREIYFHENALYEAAFDDLEVGDRVRFVEEQGVEGPQASTVHVT